jgi:hypothetical protein
MLRLHTNTWSIFDEKQIFLFLVYFSDNTEIMSHINIMNLSTHTNATELSPMNDGSNGVEWVINPWDFFWWP